MSSLQDILSISGYGGLYKHVSQTKNGIIVESLETKKRMSAYASSKISALEDIAIFTYEEEIPLIKVFKKIAEKEDGGVAVNHKSKPEELKKYFSEVLPEYDKDRVYVSDIKKVLQWYNILTELEMLEFEDEKAEEIIEENTDETTKNTKSEETKE